MDDEGELTAEAKLDIYKGLLDCHLGRLFTQDEVFPKKLKHKIRARLKRIYWRVIYPFQYLVHLRCQTCRRYKTNIKDLTKE